MKIPEHLKDIPTECIVDGRKKILSFEQAYILFWQTDFAWHRPLDFFRSDFDENAKHGLMIDVAQPTGTFFAIMLLSRGAMALALNDNCMLHEDGFEPTRDVFTANACKFGKCFNGDKIFKSVYVLDNKHRRQLAYRVKPGKKWIIVLGVDSESCFKNEETEWELFQTPSGQD